MYPLSGHDILRLWEIGRYQQPMERAITLISVACQEMGRDELLALTIGELDTYLLDIYEQCFGSKLKAYADCPKCREHLEFTIATNDIRTRRKVRGIRDEYSLEIKERGVALRFRLPNCSDLISVKGCKEPEDARNFILKRCILEATCNGKKQSTEELTEETINRLSAYMTECEPEAEVLINLRCPACTHSWQLIFDISTFFWKELSAKAKRLLQEVHLIASAYRWSERDILAMSPARRQLYLEMVK